MHLYNLIIRGDRKPRRNVIILSIVSALSNTAMMILTIMAAEKIMGGEKPNLFQAALFLACFASYYYSERKSLMIGIECIQSALFDMRLGFINSIRRSELTSVESSVGAQTYSALNKVTSHITNITPQIVDTIQQVALLVIAGAVVTYLSPLTIVAFITVCALGIIRYRFLYRRFSNTSKRTALNHEKLKSLINGCILGAKEISINQNRKEAIVSDINVLANRISKLTDLVSEHMSQMNIIGALAMYGLLGAACFVLPKFHPDNNDIVFQAVPALLFIFGPLVKTVNQMPLLAQAEAELTLLSEIQGSLTDINAESLFNPEITLTEFKSISYNNVVYNYTDGSENGFCFGPAKLLINRGETIFITGGNGSGKSTLMRVLCGLLRPSEGSIYVDETRIDQSNTRNLNQLFSSVFMNFHLPNKIYPCDDAKRSDIDELLDFLELPTATVDTHNRIKPRQLSTGQRKRLALLASILDNKPILLLDEWAAEQDVHFRDKFYKQILRKLKDSGITLIVVSHDDRYWNIADRVIKLDQGKVVWERHGADFDAK